MFNSLVIPKCLSWLFWSIWATQKVFTESFSLALKKAAHLLHDRPFSADRHNTLVFPIWKTVQICGYSGWLYLKSPYRNEQTLQLVRPTLSLFYVLGNLFFIHGGNQYESQDSNSEDPGFISWRQYSPSLLGALCFPCFVRQVLKLNGLRFLPDNRIIRIIVTRTGRAMLLRW